MRRGYEQQAGEVVHSEQQLRVGAKQQEHLREKLKSLQGRVAALGSHKVALKKRDEELEKEVGRVRRDLEQKCNDERRKRREHNLGHGDEERLLKMMTKRDKQLKMAGARLSEQPKAVKRLKGQLARRAGRCKTGPRRRWVEERQLAKLKECSKHLRSIGELKKALKANDLGEQDRRA